TYTLLVLDHVRIHASQAANGSGGAIFANQGAVTITDSELDHDKAVNAGAIMAFHAGADVTIVGSSLHDDQAVGLPSQGGQSASTMGATSRFATARCTAIARDRAVQSTMSYPDSTVTMIGATLRDNQAQYGGGLFLEGKAKLVRVLVQDNGYQ